MCISLISYALSWRRPLCGLIWHFIAFRSLSFSEWFLGNPGTGPPCRNLCIRSLNWTGVLMLTGTCYTKKPFCVFFNKKFWLETKMSSKRSQNSIDISLIHISLRLFWQSLLITGVDIPLKWIALKWPGKWGRSLCSERLLGNLHGRNVNITPSISRQRARQNSTPTMCQQCFAVKPADRKVNSWAPSTARECTQSRRILIVHMVICD